MRSETNTPGVKKQIVIFSVVMSLVLLASCGKKEEVSVASPTQVIAETSTPVDEAQTEVVNEPVVLGPGFVEYDPSVVGETENTVIFFHQESCGTCKTTEKELIENGLPVDTQVLKVDFDADSSTNLKQKYGVTMKHTFVQVDANGEMIKKWSGSLSGQDIIDQINGDVAMKEEDSAMMKKEEDTKMMEEDDSEKMMEKEEAMMKEDESTEGTVTAPVTLAGTYTDYDASLVGKTDTTVLAFFASWCPSCVAADKGISGGNVPDGLSILKTDFDSSTDLRKKYGVTSQHTYVQVDAEGNLIKKWVGGTSVEEVVEKVQ